MAASLDREWDQGRDRLSDALRTQLGRGREVRALDYQLARTRAAAFAEGLVELFQQRYDAILTPAAPGDGTRRPRLDRRSELLHAVDPHRHAGDHPAPHARRERPADRDPAGRSPPTATRASCAPPAGSRAGSRPADRGQALTCKRSLTRGGIVWKSKPDPVRRALPGVSGGGVRGRAGHGERARADRVRRPPRRPLRGGVRAAARTERRVAGALPGGAGRGAEPGRADRPGLPGLDPHRPDRHGRLGIVAPPARALRRTRA